MAADRYRIVRKLGRGGMAEVFEAVAAGDSGFQRRVAIKRVHADALRRDSAVDMFLDEARVASCLHHANIVSIIDFGVADGAPFQVLEFVDGVDLVDLLELCDELDEDIPAEIALIVGIEIANGLAYAHRAVDGSGKALGIVHRDVSPANILVSWAGDVKLSDFGIALATERTHVTQDGSAKGTLLFMSPEQMVRGEIDGRSDVFALGCVLHTLLTGQSPLESQDAMAQLLAGHEIPLSRSLSSDIAEVVRRAVHPSKAKRFPHAEAMAEALGAALVPRLKRDPKGLLRQWLASLRPSQDRPSAGAAALFQLTMTSDEAGHRRFDTTEPSVETAAARKGSPLLRTLSAALTLSGVAAGIFIWRSLEGGDPSPREPARDNGVELIASEVQILGSVDAGATPPVLDASAAVPAFPAADASAHAPRKDSTSNRPKARKRGYVAIGGRGAHRAQIFVDGKSRGYAPRALALPVGSHRIELLSAGGKTLRRTLVVRDGHTETQPLRWTVP